MIVESCWKKTGTFRTQSTIREPASDRHPGKAAFRDGVAHTPALAKRMAKHVTGDRMPILALPRSIAIIRTKRRILSFSLANACPTAALILDFRPIAHDSTFGIALLFQESRVRKIHLGGFRPLQKPASSSMKVGRIAQRPFLPSSF